MDESKKTDLLPWTGERYLSHIVGQIRLEHIHRYIWATQFVAGKKVLDIASGEGYGSQILSKFASQVTAIDADQESITFATHTYATDNLEFKVGDASKLPFEDNSIDVVVSFETIEHLSDPKVFVQEILRILTPNGLLLLSTPNPIEYTVLPGYDNPFHINELRIDELANLLSPFPAVTYYGQRVVDYSHILEFSKTTIYPEILAETTDGKITPFQGHIRPEYVVVSASKSSEYVRTEGSLFLGSIKMPPAKTESERQSPTTAKLEGTSKEKTAVLRDMEGSSINLLIAEIAALRNRIAEQDTIITGGISSANDTLRNEIESRSKETHQLRSELESLQEIAEINASLLHDSITLANDYRQRLNDTIAQLNATRSSLEDLLQSRSWRITKVIRIIGTLARKFI